MVHHAQVRVCCEWKKVVVPRSCRQGHMNVTFTRQLLLLNRQRKHCQPTRPVLQAQIACRKATPFNTNIQATRTRQVKEEKGGRGGGGSDKGQRTLVGFSAMQSRASASTQATRTWLASHSSPGGMVIACTAATTHSVAGILGLFQNSEWGKKSLKKTRVTGDTNTRNAVAYSSPPRAGVHGVYPNHQSSRECRRRLQRHRQMLSKRESSSSRK
jgi:hypothetical protein